MSRNAFVIPLVLLVGGAIGFVVGRTSTDATPPPSDDPGASRVATRDREPNERPKVVELPPDPTLKAVVEAQPVPDVPTGTGSIRGIVQLAEGGAPVADVEVTLHGRWTRPKRDHEPTLADEVRDTISEHHFRRALEQTTTTGPDGRFAFGGIAEGPTFYLTFERPGYQVFFPGMNRLRAGDEVTVQARAVAELEVAVLRSDGAAATRASLAMTGADGSRREQEWRAEYPKITVPPGRWAVVASSEELGGASDPVEVEAVAGQPAKRVELRIVAKPGVRGTVSFEEPPTGRTFLTVVLAPPGDDDAGLRRSGRRKMLHARGGWSFAFLGVEPGEYRLAVLDMHGRALHSREVTIGSGLVEADLVVPRPDASRVVYVRAIGPDGSDAPVASVGLEVESGNGHSSHGGVGERLADGRWRVRVGDDDLAKKDATFALRVRTKAYGTQGVPFRPGVDREVTVRFEAPARVDVRIVGFDGSPHAVALDLGVRRVDEPTSGFSSGRGTVDGGRRFGPLPPGEYDVELRLRIEEHRTVTIATRRTTLVAGDNEVAIGIPPIYSLTIVVDRGSDRPERLRLSSNELHLWLRATVPDDGRVVFPRLPPGDYRVESDEGKMMRVSLRSDLVLRYVPRTANAFRVTITDEAGGLARAGLRTGDLIVGVGDEEAESIAELGLLMVRHRTSTDPVDVIVLRGGRRLAIPIVVRTLMESRNGGGRVEPWVR